MMADNNYCMDSTNNNHRLEQVSYDNNNPLDGPVPSRNLTEEEIEDRTMRLDGLPQVTKFGFLFTIYSMLMYIADTGLDCYVAYGFHVKGHNTYFGLTLFFVLVPAVVTTSFSIILYILDSKNPDIPTPTYGQKVQRWIFSALQLGPVLRDVNVLNYGIRSILALRAGNLPLQRDYFKAMQLEESDASFLRLFERFLEAAPQVTLQLFVIIHHIHDPDADFDGKLQRISILTSLVSLAWSLTSYNNTARTTMPGKKILTYWGKLYQFLWNLCMIFSRVCALAFFASAHPMWIGPLCIMHWAVMLFWLVRLDSQKNLAEQTDNDEETPCLETLSSFVMNVIFAYVYVFVFLNVIDEPTRRKYWIFYTVILVQNTVFIFSSIDSATHSEVYWTMLMSYGSFFLGFIFMFIYFKWFHPSLIFSSVDGALRHMIDLSPPRNAEISGQNGRDRCNGNASHAGMARGQIHSVQEQDS